MSDVMGGMMQGVGMIASVASRRKDAKAARERDDYYARHGIAMKVADAKAAGIHPLAALGAQTYQPSFHDGGSPNYGEALSQMGQSISRAASASQRKEQQAQIQQMNAAQLRNAQLKNQLLEQQITSISKSNNPGLPSNSGLPGSMTASGQGDAYVLEKPLERTHSAHGSPHQEIGHVSDVGYSRTKTGLAPVPSRDVKERIEDQLIPEMSWAIRNQMLPNLGTDNKPSKKLLPKGYADWRWSHKMQEWQPITHAEKHTHKVRGRGPWRGSEFRKYKRSGGR